MARLASIAGLRRHENEQKQACKQYPAQNAASIDCVSKPVRKSMFHAKQQCSPQVSHRFHDCIVVMVRHNMSCDQSFLDYAGEFFTKSFHGPICSSWYRVFSHLINLGTCLPCVGPNAITSGSYASSSMIHPLNPPSVVA